MKKNISVLGPFRIAKHKQHFFIFDVKISYTDSIAFYLYFFKVGKEICRSKTFVTSI